MSEPPVAVIDIGTVTARLAVSHVHDGHVELIKKVSTICNLGENVDKSGELTAGAIDRVSTCVSSYVEQARALGTQVSVCTLTSAARDARNSQELLDRLEACGVAPQIIPGKVEGRLTFRGVAQDFPNTPLLVADNGGGSTELVSGVLIDSPDQAQPRLAIDLVHSTRVGCRRLTDRYLSHSVRPSADDLHAAHEFAAQEFDPVLARLRHQGVHPEVLVATGGTVTTLAAVEQELVPYDSSRVHLYTLTREQVEQTEERLARLTVDERAQVVGIQPKRAPVILAGVVAIAELMNQAGFDKLIVSESDLLVGLTLACTDL